MTRSVTASRDILPNPAVSDPVADHRTDYWQWVDDHASPEHKRRLLLGLRDYWRDCNQDYFDGRMLEPYITLTEPSAPQIYGQCWPVSSWGSRLEIKIRPSLLAGKHPHLRGAERIHRERFTYDVLLHEMVHQHVMEHEPGVDESSYHGHGAVFTEHCNRIGALLGLPEVVVRNRKGKPKKPKSAQWPHNVQPADRYGGFYKPFGVTASRDTTRWVPAGYLPVAIAPDDTGELVAIDFESESDATDPTLRIRLDADAAAQLAELLNGFFADETPDTEAVVTPLEHVVDRYSPSELFALTGQLIELFAGQDVKK